MSRNLLDLDRDVRDKAMLLLDAAKARGVHLIVTQTYRTFPEQDAIYAQVPKVSNARAGYSWHNWRRAFDVAIQDFPGDHTPNDVYDGPWAEVGQLGEMIGLQWGGRWSHHPDLPHFEDVGGRTLAGMLKMYPQGYA